MRSRPLDILRAIAVLLVLGRHLPACPIEVSAPLHWLTELWQRGGWAGVDLFFVLSGYLVSGLLFKEYLKTRKVKIGRFLIRRGFKIYPAFYVLILATVVLIPGNVTAPKLLAELFFVQNYFSGLWGHTWSLAVEEHFYLLLAICFGYVKFFRKSIPLVFILIALTCLGLRIFVTLQYRFDNETNVFPTHLRLDSLAFGVLISYIKFFSGDWFNILKRRWFLIPGVLGFVPFFIWPLEHPFTHTVGFTLAYLASGMLLMGAIGADASDWFSRVVGALGSRSYSLYLWHLPVLVVAVWIANWYLLAATYLIGSVGVGMVMNFIIETPMLKLRDRLYPRS